MDAIFWGYATLIGSVVVLGISLGLGFLAGGFSFVRGLGVVLFQAVVLYILFNSPLRSAYEYIALLEHGASVFWICNLGFAVGALTAKWINKR